MTEVPKDVESVKCPYCGMTVSVIRGSYAYVVSQVASHLDRCTTLPEAERESVMERASEAVTKRLNR